MMKKTLSLLLAMLILASLLCLTGCGTSAAKVSGSGTEEDPWLCGAAENDNITVYVSDTTLWIDGEGAMMDFDDPASRPWNDVIGDMEQVSIFGDLAHIGSNAFKDAGKNVDNFDIFLANIVEIGDSTFEGANFCEAAILNIPESVTSIGARAFADTPLQRVDFNSTPAISEDAFANVTAKVYTINGSDWNEANMLPYGGTLDYKTLYVFNTETDYGTDDITGSGTMLIPEDEVFEYNAADYNCEEGYHFVRWEVVDGDLTLDDPTNPAISVQLTGDVSVKEIFAADKK